jgi:hypothetical protein
MTNDPKLNELLQAAVRRWRELHPPTAADYDQNLHGDPARGFVIAAEDAYYEDMPS